MSLSDFPNEVLEHICGFLDSDSLAAFSEVSFRCRDVVHKAVTSLHFTQLNTWVSRLIKWYGVNIRRLDMSNCEAPSKQLEGVITKCSGLEELCVVNTRLTIRAVLTIVERLRRLEVIRVGMTTSNAPTLEDFRGVAENDHVRRVYIEVLPLEVFYLCALSLINRCVRIEWLHIFVVDSVPPLDPYLQHWFSRNERGMLLDERWSTLHTLILSSEARCSSQRLLSLALRLFRIPRDHHRALLVSAIAEFKAVIYERGHTNLILVKDRPQIDEAALEDEQLYPAAEPPGPLHYLQQSLAVCMNLGDTRTPLRTPGWGAPRGLVVSFSPPGVPVSLRWLDNLLTPKLTELDLTMSHWAFRQKTWSDLVDAAPALEALAIPACFLPSSMLPPKSGVTKHGSVWAKRIRIAPSATSDDCPLIDVLSKLRLRQLYIRGDRCRSCSIRQDPMRVLGKVCELPHLVSLSLVHVPLSSPFLHGLSSPTVKTLKLLTVGKTSNCELLIGLRGLIQQSRSLENLKLEHEKLPLGSALLWEGLAEASRLRQLCLSSKCPERVDLNLVAKNLARIRHNLRHIHVHGRPVNSRQLEKCLKRVLSEPTETNTSSVTPGRASGNAGKSAQPSSSKSLSNTGKATSHIGKIQRRTGRLPGGGRPRPRRQQQQQQQHHQQLQQQQQEWEQFEQQQRQNGEHTNGDSDDNDDEENEKDCAEDEMISDEGPVGEDNELEHRHSCVVFVTPTSPFASDRDKNVRYPIPGRSVCFSGHFIGHVKPEGWEFY